MFSSHVFADFAAGLVAYFKGDYATAAKEFKAAAEQGDAYAQNNLADMYAQGQGVTQDYKEAVKWYRLAAERGVAKAQYNLGAMYKDGQGVTQDYKEAVKWYRLAAEQGYVFAQFNLGYAYQRGLGITPDYKKAESWYLLAAEQGDARAQQNLGLMYALGGKGVIENFVLAYMWLNIVSKGEKVKEAINILESVMTLKQITKAKELSVECIKKNYKNCG